MSRDLNIEVIRIFAMLLIVLGHIAGNYIPNITDASIGLRTYLSVLCFFIPFHVNLFVLISGYCGIKSWKSLLKLWVLLFSTQICVATISLAFGLEWSFCWQSFIFPLTHNDWWFMRIYVMLCILAPAIEQIIKYCKQQDIYKFIIALLCLDIYMGFIHRVETINYDGYNLLHFSTIYFIGIFLRDRAKTYAKHKRLIFVTIVGISLFKVLWHLVLIYFNIEDRYTDYNNPFNIISAILIFVFMMNLSFHSKWITTISSSVIGVYLFSEAPPIRKWLINTCANNLSYNDSLSKGLMFVLILWVGIFIGAIIIDKIRLFLFTPLIRSTTNIGKRIDQLVKI